MKISFIIGTYNPGKCGISDYVDLLSKKLEKLGHTVVKNLIETPNDFVRFSKNLGVADLYSFQFAPYAFSRSGLSGNNLLAIAHALQSKKVQVNFHEIWIGAYPKANLKEKVMGWRQKREILKFLRIVKP